MSPIIIEESPREEERIEETVMKEKLQKSQAVYVALKEQLATMESLCIEAL